MEKRIVFGERILKVKCSDKCNPKIYKAFFGLLKKYKDELIDLMDENEIPEEVFINIKGGESELAGFYYEHDLEVSKNLVVIDIYTRPIEKVLDDGLEMELLDVFAHEIIHHVIEDEEETGKRTKKFMGKLG